MERAYAYKGRKDMNLVCPICNTKNILVSTQLNRPEYTRCVECGMIYSVERYDDKKRAEIYNEFDFGKYYEQYVKQPEHKLRNIKLFRQFWMCLVDYIDIPNYAGVAFEIGSSAGHLLKAGLDSNRLREVHGFEFCEKIAKYAVDNSIPTTHCDFETLDYNLLKKEYYDIGMASHVIEHFADPIRAFQRIKYLLKPKGLFITLHPDVDVYPGCLFHVRKEVAVGEHLNMFGLNQLSSLIKKIGGLELVYRKTEEPGQSINIIRKVE